jgi:hypothetical protein
MDGSYPYLIRYPLSKLETWGLPTHYCQGRLENGTWEKEIQTERGKK